jgi:hypothetical protein
MTRTPDAALGLISGIDVVNNFAFLARDGVTVCNCYVTCCTAALGCAVPPMLANKQHEWLMSSEGQLAGWLHVDSETARQRATLGYPTVVSWLNPEGHGHIALCVPPPTGDARLFVSAAGLQNFVRAPIERSFGIGKTLSFFTHQ